MRLFRRAIGSEKAGKQAEAVTDPAVVATPTSSLAARSNDHLAASSHESGLPMSSRSHTTQTPLFGPNDDLPRMEGFHLWHRKWSNLAYALFILMFNLAMPCLLYYPLRHYTTLSEQTLIGIASGTLGISSSFDNPFRMLKLWRHRDLYGPLNDDVRWHLDWTMHLYSFSLFPIFAIPLAISSSVNPPMHDFFIMSTPMLVAVPGIYFIVTLFAPKTPCWMSSDPPGTVMKPGVFYMFEDIGAVDFRHGKEFRRVLHARYNSSPIYRDLMWYETLWWAWGCAIYFGMIAGIAWSVSFDVAFGLVLGLLFAWASIWAILSVVIAKHFHRKENVWLEAQRSNPELAKEMTREGQADIMRERRASRRQSSRPQVEKHQSSDRTQIREQARQMEDESSTGLNGHVSHSRPSESAIDD